MKRGYTSVCLCCTIYVLVSESKYVELIIQAPKILMSLNSDAANCYVSNFRAIHDKTKAGVGIHNILFSDNLRR